MHGKMFVTVLCHWWSLWCYRGWTTETVLEPGRPSGLSSSVCSWCWLQQHGWSATWDPQTTSPTHLLASIGCASPSRSSTRSLCWRTKSCRSRRHGSWDSLFALQISLVDGHCAQPALVACWYHPSGSQQLFTVTGPRVWNTLPEEMTSAPSLTIWLYSSLLCVTVSAMNDAGYKDMPECLLADELSVSSLKNPLESTWRLVTRENSWLSVSQSLSLWLYSSLLSFWIFLNVLNVVKPTR